jgi:hypothetical protein
MPAWSRPCLYGCDRRRLLQLAGGAGLAALFPFAASAQSLETAEVRTLLLICNEPGVWQPASNYIKSRQELVGKYEPVEIDGAAIGLVAAQYKDSHQAFWDKLMAAAAFQQTQRVIALNHRGCAAMKIAYGLTKTSDRLIETQTHRYALQEFRKQMAERNAGVDVWIGLIGLDGKVEMFS